MNGLAGPWGIAGGWALDLFLGHQSRPHADVDVAVLREDQQYLRSRLTEAWTEKVVDGHRSEWLDGEWLAPPVHEIHATWTEGPPLEFLLNEHDHLTGEWVFRRDSRIRRSIAAAFVTGTDVPFLAPELVLLYKSKTPSSTDQADLNAVLPRLELDRRSWLGEALAITAPGHPWATLLAQEP